MRPGRPRSYASPRAPRPRSGPDDVLIAVEAAGVSHADVMQRAGKYPPPPGASRDSRAWRSPERSRRRESASRSGAQAIASARLTNGGGYAEYVAVPQGQVLPIRRAGARRSRDAAGERLHRLRQPFHAGAPERGETVLVHGGTSGIGSTAIMFARALGATRDRDARAAPRKCAACIAARRVARDRLSHDTISWRRLAPDGGRGVDVVLDIVGGDYVARDLDALALGRRIACIATPARTDRRARSGRLFAQARHDLRLELASAHRRTESRDRARAANGDLAAAARRDPIVPLVDSVYPFERAPRRTPAWSRARTSARSCSRLRKTRC